MYARREENQAWGMCPIYLFQLCNETKQNWNRFASYCDKNVALFRILSKRKNVRFISVRICCFQFCQILNLDTGLHLDPFCGSGSSLANNHNTKKIPRDLFTSWHWSHSTPTFMAYCVESLFKIVWKSKIDLQMQSFTGLKVFFADPPLRHLKS